MSNIRSTVVQWRCGILVVALVLCHMAFSFTRQVRDSRDDPCVVPRGT